VTPSELATVLGLEPHPEGGWYRRTWAHPVTDGDGRALGSAILYVPPVDGSPSAWHRFDAVELWHHHQGAAVELTMWSEGDPSGATTVRLGADLADGQVPQAVVPAGAWQSARSLGGWSLVGCTVVPEFRFETFEMATEGWSPPSG
jgi:predicted cupin superfamily sugar epimerase